MKSRVLLVDADISIFQATTVTERPVNWGDGLWTLHCFEDEAIRVFEDGHAKLMETLDADHAIYCLTDSVNWRKGILPTYKANRANVRKPMLLPFMQQYLLDNYDTYLRPSLEGDDVMGILSTHPTIVKADQKIIVSLDKDMKTIPGWVYNPGKDLKPRLITEDEADYWHMLQALMGDATDGYAGCPGTGPKGAETVLADPRRFVEETYEVTRGKDKGQTKTRWIDDGPAESLWEAVVCHYAKAGLTEEDALVQARVARILRASDYNLKTKEVIPWKPLKK